MYLHFHHTLVRFCFLHLAQTLRETHRREIALDARDHNGNTMLMLSTMYRLVLGCGELGLGLDCAFTDKRSARCTIVSYLWALVGTLKLLKFCLRAKPTQIFLTTAG